MAEIRLPRSIKDKYGEIVPVLSGHGGESMITLFGRLRDDPSKLEKIISRAWEPDEQVSIIWEESGVLSSG